MAKTIKLVHEWLKLEKHCPWAERNGTICLHPNMLRRPDAQYFAEDLRRQLPWERGRCDSAWCCSKSPSVHRKVAQNIPHLMGHLTDGQEALRLLAPSTHHSDASHGLFRVLYFTLPFKLLLIIILNRFPQHKIGRRLTMISSKPYTLLKKKKKKALTNTERKFWQLNIQWHTEIKWQELHYKDTKISWF